MKTDRKVRRGIVVKFKQYLYLRDEAIERLAQGTTTEEEWDLQTYAFVGDAVYSVFVRTHLAATGIAKTRVLHDLAARLVAAKIKARYYGLYGIR